MSENYEEIGKFLASDAAFMAAIIITINSSFCVTPFLRFLYFNFLYKMLYLNRLNQ